MTDKELIKQEIEKRIKEGSSKNDISEGALALDSLLDFIDSLPEQSGCEVNFTTKSEDLEEEINNYIKDNFFGSGSIGFFSNRTKQELNSIDVANIARHFAEWQEKKMLGIAEAFYQQGRYEQKQEMLKDAVNGEYWIGEIHLDTPIIQGYDDGDRIKFIPIKEIQQ